LQACDPSVATFSAEFRSVASTIQNPARNSFVSTNGPSVMIDARPRLSITVDDSGEPRRDS